ncbi:MAG TPA: sigma-70 family RNA polymerase sigma factor [Actinomycetota bacterium]|nr:sigma-70 family RNA polymerase sigma factor [Actinomycetota bacterium]
MENGPSDEELVRRYRAGDGGAFTDLVRRHEPRVYNLALRMLGRAEDARDAAQDTFLTVLRKLDGFRGDARFTTWLYRVTSNTCYDLLRKRRREGPATDELPETAAPDDPESAAIARADVARAIGKVPEEFRLVLLLHDVEDLGHAEIASIVGVPIGTVKSRLHRGRVALGRLLSDVSGRDEAGGTPVRRAPSKHGEDR